MQAVELVRVNDRMSDSLAGALAPVEYGYYFIIVYTVLGAPLGLIVGGLGSGFLMIPVLGLCFYALGPSILKVLQTSWIPLACGASYLFIQLALHGESLYGMYVYQFGPWLLSLVIVQSLVMHRPNFLHRFAWFTLLLGLAMLPFIRWDQVGQYTKLSLDRAAGVGYANANALAGWFGFCVLYLAIKGYVETRPAYRLAAWLMAACSLYVVTLTVSRASLIALVAALFVASGRLLKVTVFPLLLIVGLALGLMELGVFDQAIRAYMIRGGEDTGRLSVWPLLIEKFLSSPVIGVGASNAGEETYPGHFVTPHNGFLLFAVASGAMPLILFCAYFFRSGTAALRAKVSERQDAVFHLPLVVYALLIVCAGNMEFMAPWAIVSLAVPIAASVSRMNRRTEEMRGLRISSPRPEKVNEGRHGRSGSEAEL